MGRVTRHVVLFLASALMGAAFYWILDTDRMIWWLSMTTAYASLALLALSLMIGPWNKLRGLRNPVSSYLRRDIGIWAGVLGIVHVIAGLQVHFIGKMWLYFLPPPDASYRFPLRIDLAGLSHWVGLFATFILLLLLFLSNDASLGRYGARRWKSLQRWNYAGAILVVAHGFSYQYLERRTLDFIVVYTAIVLLVMAMQYAGYRAVKNSVR